MSSKEQLDMDKAIALSLQEAEKKQSSSGGGGGGTGASKSGGFYPSLGGAGASSFNPVRSSSPVNTGRKVRALYDFEGVESDELTFKSGDIINIIDDSDPNWWNGSTSTSRGLFPANFVTSDLTAQVETGRPDRHVSFQDKVEVKEFYKPIVIDPSKIQQMLSLLENADPTGESVPDSQEMVSLEAECKGMGPLIDAELELIDKSHANLAEVNNKVIAALKLYNKLMQDVEQRQMHPTPNMGAAAAGGMPSFNTGAMGGGLAQQMAQPHIPPGMAASMAAAGLGGGGAGYMNPAVAAATGGYVGGAMMGGQQQQQPPQQQQAAGAWNPQSPHHMMPQSQMSGPAPYMQQQQQGQQQQQPPSAMAPAVGGQQQYPSSHMNTAYGNTDNMTNHNSSSGGQYVEVGGLVAATADQQQQAQAGQTAAMTMNSTHPLPLSNQTVAVSSISQFHTSVGQAQPQQQQPGGLGPLPGQYSSPHLQQQQQTDPNIAGAGTPGLGGMPPYLPQQPQQPIHLPQNPLLYQQQPQQQPLPPQQQQHQQQQVM